MLVDVRGISLARMVDLLNNFNTKKRGKVGLVLIIIAVILLAFIIIFLMLFRSPEQPEELSEVKIDYLKDVDMIAQQIKQGMLTIGNMDLIGELVACSAYLDDNPGECDRIKNEENRDYCVARVESFNNVKALWDFDCASVDLETPYNIRKVCISAKENDCAQLTGNEQLICEQLVWKDFEKCDDAVHEKINCRNKIIMGHFLSGDEKLCDNYVNFIEKKMCVSIAGRDCSYMNEGIFKDLAVIQIEKFHNITVSVCDKVVDKELQELCVDDSSEYSDIIMIIKGLSYDLV